MQPGMTVSAVARLHGVSTSLLFGCRRHMGEGGRAAIQADDDVVAAGWLRELEGRVIAPASNLRWSSDGLEIPCWNGEVVRLAFAIDTHDREVMAYVATTSGIRSEMIRDLMLACVERRFAALRAPHPVQWLADNGSAYTPPTIRGRSPWR